MKKKLFAVFACLIILALIAIPVAAQTDWTEFEGVISREVGYPCGEEYFSKDGTKVFGRDCLEEYSIVVNDERLEGTLYLTFNFNFKFTGVPPALFYGPIWGSLIIENDGGYWEGNNIGKRTEEGFNYGFSVLHGHGDYEGMLAQVYFTREIIDPFGDIMMHGVIK